MTKRTHSYFFIRHHSRHFPPGTSLNGTNVNSSGVTMQGLALNRLLLLCMVASEVWESETKPIDFECNAATRKALNIVSQMDSALSDCNGSMTLFTQFQLPCTELHIASWENKSDQEKRGDIVASLGLLIEGVKAEKALRQSECEASILQTLNHNINNYLLILTHLQLSGPVVAPSLSCVPRNTHSLRTVLRSYNQLISAKLERLMLNLENRCTSR